MYICICLFFIPKFLFCYVKPSTKLGISQSISNSSTRLSSVKKPQITFTHKGLFCNIICKTSFNWNNDFFHNWHRALDNFFQMQLSQYRNWMQRKKNKSCGVSTIKRKLFWIFLLIYIQLPLFSFIAQTFHFQTSSHYQYANSTVFL